MNDINNTANPARPALIYGWAALAFFILLGLFLESLHLFKAPFYFEVEIRRELWTLAHAHGALLALVNVVWAVCAARFDWAGRGAGWATRMLITAGVLVPGGFFLGGFGNSESDPSLWIVLTPVGALAAAIGALLALRCALGTESESVESAPVTPAASKSRRR